MRIIIASHNAHNSKRNQTDTERYRYSGHRLDEYPDIPEAPEDHGIQEPMPPSSVYI